MINLVLKLLDAFWNLLPKRVKIHFIQSKKNYGYLDTPKKKIVMKLESIDTLKRLYSCKKEPETIKWLESNVNDTEVLFDIGANVGAYSLYAAGVLGAKVYSFEPSPSTFHLLLENVQLNKLTERIVPFNMPLSSTTDLKVFKYSTLEAGSASHSGLENAMGATNEVSQPVMTVTLDDLVQKYNVPAPNHMKIDVDGHELSILQGGSAVLQSKELKTIQIELSKQDNNYDTIVNMLKGFQFKIGHVNAHPNSTNTDIVFVK
jgi:FkbM family methyltransferase